MLRIDFTYNKFHHVISVAMGPPMEPPIEAPMEPPIEAPMEPPIGPPIGPIAAGGGGSDGGSNVVELFNPLYISFSPPPKSFIRARR